MCWEMCCIGSRGSNERCSMRRGAAGPGRRGQAWQQPHSGRGAQVECCSMDVADNRTALRPACWYMCCIRCSLDGVATLSNSCWVSPKQQLHVDAGTAHWEGLQLSALEQTFMCQLQSCKAVWRLPFSTEGQCLTGASGSLDVLAAVLQGAPALTQCRKGGTHRGK